MAEGPEGFSVPLPLFTVVDEATFQTAANNAKDGCPISRALQGNVEVTVDARHRLVGRRRHAGKSSAELGQDAGACERTLLPRPPAADDAPRERERDQRRQDRASDDVLHYARAARAVCISDCSSFGSTGLVRW